MRRPSKSLISRLPERDISIALLLASALHILVLSLFLNRPPPTPQSPPIEDALLEVMVVREPKPAPRIEQAVALAQVTQQGGGNTDQPELGQQPRQASAPPPTIDADPPQPADTANQPAVETLPPEPSLEPDPAEVATESTPEPAPPVEVAPIAPPSPEPPPLATPAETPQVAAEPRPPRDEPPPPRKDPPAKPEIAQVTPPRPVSSAPSPAPEKPPRKQRVSAADLLASTRSEIDRLSDEIDRHSEEQNLFGPRARVISASTQEYKYAAYQDAWRRKVERIGNLNYPEQARRDRIYGSLILIVGIDHQGQVTRIQVERSSGFELLDQAAINIVRLAAPFAPLPANIRDELDVLYIRRTWHFRETNQLTSK